MSELRDKYLLEDYQQKAQFLTGHLSRMWTRFNFFIVLETALSVAVFNHSSQQTTGIVTLSDDRFYLAVVGLVSSVAWYVFIVNDRYLAQMYRTHLRTAKARIMAALADEETGMGQPGSSAGQLSSPGNPDAQVNAQVNSSALSVDPYVGELRAIERIPTTLYQWRTEILSLTRFVAYFALIAIAYWIFLLVAVV